VSISILYPTNGILDCANIRRGKGFDVSTHLSISAESGIFVGNSFIGADMGREIRSYTSEDKRLAASLFSIYGNYSMVAEKLSFPVRTVTEWQNDEEFNAALAISRQAVTQEHIQRSLNNITLAQVELTDRLTNGDTTIVRGKDGFDVVKTPVKAKDLAVVMSNASQHAQLLQHRPTSISGSIDQRLLAIAETLARAARDAEARTVQGQILVIDQPR